MAQHQITHYSPFAGTDRRPSRRNHLIGKVVLLVGNDPVDLQALATPLAQRGADIALYCQSLKSGAAKQMRQSVEAAKQHFFLISEARDSVSPQQVVEAVTERFGHLDIFIDLSAQPNETLDDNDPLEKDDESEQAVWQLTQAALEEIISVH